MNSLTSWFGQRSFGLKWCNLTSSFPPVEEEDTLQKWLRPHLIIFRTSLATSSKKPHAHRWGGATSSGLLPWTVPVVNYWHYVTLFWEVLHTHAPLFLEDQRSGVLSHWPQTKYNLKRWNDPRKGGTAVIWTFLSHDLGLKICKTEQVFQGRSARVNGASTGLLEVASKESW